MNRIIPDRNGVEVQDGEERRANFRSNVIDTLNWFCSEKEFDDIAPALEELFAATVRCSLLKCYVTTGPDDSLHGNSFPDEENAKDQTATEMNFYPEFSDNACSLVQFRINGRSAEGNKPWQVILQLAVRATSDQVWETILNDIGRLPHYPPEDDAAQLNEPVPEIASESLNLLADTNSNREINIELIANELVHELRNPLSAIITAAGLVNTRNDRMLPLEDVKLLEIVESEAQGIDDMLRRLLRMFEPLSLHKITLNLADLLEDTAEHLSNDRDKPAIRLHPSSDISFLVIDADPKLLRTALTFMMRGLPLSLSDCRSVDVNCRRKGDSVAIEFEYNSYGIRPDLLRKVVFPSFTTKDGGSGLGMPPPHRIIAAHDGKMIIGSSEAGTVVTMILPNVKRKKRTNFI